MVGAGFSREGFNEGDPMFTAVGLITETARLTRFDVGRRISLDLRVFRP